MIEKINYFIFHTITVILYLCLFLFYGIYITYNLGKCIIQSIIE